MQNCTTCQATFKGLQPGGQGYEMQDIKLEVISSEDLDKLKSLAGSYEALFSRRAMKYKEMGLKDKKLSENDYRNLILSEYTFLKRPVVVSGSKILIGSEKKTVEEIKKLFSK
jgi:arsenate reductase (glutaredoxin)